MKCDASNLIWLDLEMTGLSPDQDKILEIAVVITDAHLNVLAEGPQCVISQSQETLERMQPFVRDLHVRSGLLDQVYQSSIKETEAEQTVLAFLKEYVPANASPLCGNSICMDRRFLYQWMPSLEKYFHYRHLDVSTLKVLASLWAPRVFDQVQKSNDHRALADVYESIEELKHYREHFLRMEDGF